MMEIVETYSKEVRCLTTPRAAAVAGILFALLFAVSLILLRKSIPESLSADTEWVVNGSGADQHRPRPDAVLR